MATISVQQIQDLFSSTRFSDRPPTPDPEKHPQDELSYMQEHYPTWRSMFRGDYFKELLKVDDGTSDSLRWPVQFNLPHAYAITHAGMLWGRGSNTNEATDLFDIKVNPKVPGQKPMTSAAPRFEDALQYFWSYWSDILRQAGADQQWAGGAVIKVAWRPWDPRAVYGVVLEVIQPEYFYPVWSPVSGGTMLAAKIKFKVPRIVAEYNYGLTATQLRQQPDEVDIEEYWDQTQYYIALGPDGEQIVADIPGIGPAVGSNPWVSPVTMRGIIPIYYIPRLRAKWAFHGDSLVEELEGLAREFNKTVADVGDALTGSTHVSMLVADFHALGLKSTKDGRPTKVSMPTDGIMHLGITPPGGHLQGRAFNVPAPSIPSETSKFSEGLLGLADMAGQVTKAVHGQDSQESGFGAAMAMLPTLNLVDWTRTMWTQAIAGRSGINELLGTIFFHQWSRGLTIVPPGILPGALSCRQSLQMRAVVPRDRAAQVDEVVRLVTAKAIPPVEALRRLGDIEDVEKVLGELWTYLLWQAVVDASVAGRALTVDHRDVDPENPPLPRAEVSGEVTAQPKSKPAASQPQGQTGGTT